MNPITTKLLQAAGYAAAGVATKAVGSAYRVKDDLEAPKDVFHKTVKREGALLAIAGGFLMGIQLLFTGLIYKRMPNISPFLESVTRLALAVPAFAVAEVVSRKWGGSRSEIWQEGQLAEKPYAAQGYKNPIPPDALDRPRPEAASPGQPAFARMPVPPVAFMDGGLSFVPSSGYYQRSNPAGLYFHA